MVQMESTSTTMHNFCDFYLMKFLSREVKVEESFGRVCATLQQS